MARSGTLSLSHVSVNTKAQQSFTFLWDERSSRMSSSLFSSERTLARTIEGMAGLCGLAASLARMPPRLPLFCFLSHRLRRIHCGRSAGVGVGDLVGLRSRPRSFSFSVSTEFNLKSLFLPMSRRSVRAYPRLHTDRRDKDLQKHCNLQDEKHEKVVCLGEREAAACARAAILENPWGGPGVKLKRWIGTVHCWTLFFGDVNAVPSSHLVPEQFFKRGFC